MSARSRGARAVVTGAGSGIGAAFAHELARRGGQVVCADIDPARAEQTAVAIRAAGGQALALTCDVSELEEVEKLAAGAAEWFGAPATLVVNNAGVGTGGQPVGELPIEDWRWALGVNLWGRRTRLPRVRPGPARPGRRRDRQRRLGRRVRRGAADGRLQRGQGRGDVAVGDDGGGAVGHRRRGDGAVPDVRADQRRPGRPDRRPVRRPRRHPHGLDGHVGRCRRPPDPRRARPRPALRRPAAARPADLAPQARKPRCPTRGCSGSRCDSRTH